MAKFQTPQFIEHEAKVIGPLSFRQAGYIGAPLPAILLLYFIFPNNLVLFVALTVILEGLAFTLAFVKVEGRTVPQLLTHALFFGIKPKMYIWKRGKATLHFKEMEYEGPEGQTEDVKKSDVSQRSRVQSLAIQVQTKQ